MYKVNISHQGKKYFKDTYYDLVLSDKELIKVGYIIKDGVTKEFKGKIKKK
jgi:hypothetical protein